MKTDLMNLKLLRQARGQSPADMVLKNCQVIDVFCGAVELLDVAICEDRIAGIGSYDGIHEIDCKGAYVSPGFMEGHIHIESSMLCPEQFGATVIGHGTTTVVCDPHEIANVSGFAGINYFNEASRDLPCHIFLMAPSCVPATHLESSGAILGSADMERMLQLENVIGVAEMMNFPGVLFEDREVLRKVEIGTSLGVPVDGHAPGVTGRDLQAYVGCGIMSDHECTTADEAREKLRSGMFLFIREGSTAKNMEALLPVVTEKNCHRCLLVTDDCHPQKLLEEGHLDRLLRRAVGLGLDPLIAIRMVTINVASYYGFRDRGAVAPGYRADLVLFDDLQDIRPNKVFSGGRQVRKSDSSPVIDKKVLAGNYPEVFNSVHVDLDKLSFAIPAEGKIARIIKIVTDELITEGVERSVKLVDGFAVADPENDIAKLAVIERHKGTGNTGLGFVEGLGLHKGAIASTVGHDSHNITVVGVDDGDMKLAVETVVRQGGGLAVVANGNVRAVCILEVAGLMMNESAKEAADRFSEVIHAAKRLGAAVDDPFMIMSFLTLPVIPHLRMTDLGLVDVNKFSHIGLWV